MNPVGSGSDSQRGPPPLPPGAKGKTSLSDPMAPPPLPERIDDEEPEPTNPSIRTTEYRKKELLQVLRAFYPDEKSRIDQNGNALPALQLHLKEAREDLLLKFEAQTLFFFRIRVKWVAAAATILALAAGGIAIRSCIKANNAQAQVETQKNEIQELKKKIEQLEKAKPKPTSFYIPKALSKPPQIPSRIPQKVARNSLPA